MNFKRFILYGIPKSFLFKLILALIIILAGKNVFAKEFNMNNYTSATLNGTKKRYRATEIYNTGTSGTYTFGTKYNGRISDIETYFEYPVVSGLTYRLTYNMATDDFRNNFGSSYWWDCSHEMTNANATVFQPSYISYKKVQFSFTPTEDTTCIRVWLRSKNLSSTAITGVSNWTLSSITIYDPDFQDTPTPTPTPTSTPSSATNQDIINNQNQNTQDIINNQNQNTQDIINNQNQNTQDLIDNNNTNTQDLIESQQSCQVYDINSIDTDNSVLHGSSIETSTSWGITKYINITGGKINVLQYNTNSYASFCFYNINKSVIQCKYLTDFVDEVPIPENATFIRVSIDKRISKPVFKLCKNGNQSVSDSVNDLNDTISNPNVDGGTGSDFFNDFSSDDNGGISGIITKPLVLINSLLSSNDNCNNLPLSITFPGLSSKQVTFPSGCILWNNVPSNVVNIYQIFFVGFCSYYLLKRLFKDVEDLKNPEKDNVEVIDL